MSQLPTAAQVYVVLTVLAGIAVLAYGLAHFAPAAPLPLAAFLAAGMAASRLKVKLPGVNGTMSVNLPFFLIVAAQLSVSEAVLVAFFGSLAQSLGRPGARPGNRPVQVVFNAALLITAVGLAALALAALEQRHLAPPWAVMSAAAVYFAANTVPVAMLLWLAEGERPVSTWRRIAALTFPYYVLSAGLAAMVCVGVRNAAWTVLLALLLVMYLTHRSYRLYFGRFGPGPKPAVDAVSST